MVRKFTGEAITAAALGAIAAASAAATNRYVSIGNTGCPPVVLGAETLVADTAAVSVGINVAAWTSSVLLGLGGVATTVLSVALGVFGWRRFHH